MHVNTQITSSPQLPCLILSTTQEIEEAESQDSTPPQHTWIVCGCLKDPDRHCTIFLPSCSSLIPIDGSAVSICKPPAELPYTISL